MSSENSNVVAGIKLRTDKPTNIALHRLYGWVIWQFPRPQGKGYQGAIRPPEAGQNWIPAVIRAEENRVKIFSNAGKTYASPEKAMEYFQETKKRSK